MGFLLKAAFWLAVVVILLPTPEDSRVVSHNGTAVDGVEAIGAAREFVSDMGSFCERNREACDTGIAAAQQFGVKAQYGAKMLYDYLGEFTGQDGEALNVSRMAPQGQSSEALATGTLTQHDLEVTPRTDAAVIRPVRSLRMPVETAPRAMQPVGSTMSGFEADPIGSMAQTSWRAPLTRTELSPATQPADGIGGLINQGQ